MECHKRLLSSNCHWVFAHKNRVMVHKETGIRKRSPSYCRTRASRIQRNAHIVNHGIQDFGIFAETRTSSPQCLRVLHSGLNISGSAFRSSGGRCSVGAHFCGGAAIVWNHARIRSGFQLMHNVPETALSGPEARAPTGAPPSKEQRAASHLAKIGDQSDP